MAYVNRKLQLLNTLKSISMSKIDKKDYEIIIVDDCSNELNKLNDIKQIFNDLNIKIIEIDKSTKWWINPCVVYNIGFKQIKNDIVIIQNAENIHNGDILTDIRENFKENDYRTYACYSLRREETIDLNNLDNINIKNRKIKCVGDNGWYNHSLYNKTAYHFCSVISKQNLFKLNGFDEKFANGIGCDDDELKRRIELLYLNINIIDKPFVIHQWHYNKDCLTVKAIFEQKYIKLYEHNLNLLKEKYKI